jgi:hypothetical protein
MWIKLKYAISLSKATVIFLPVLVVLESPFYVQHWNPNDFITLEFNVA